jgi:hypothetical protein
MELLDAIDKACSRTKSKAEYKALDRLFFAVPRETRRAWLLAQAAKWDRGE